MKTTALVRMTIDEIAKRQGNWLFHLRSARFGRNGIGKIIFYINDYAIHLGREQK